MRYTMLAAAGLLALAGCKIVVPAPGPQAPACDAAGLQGLVGQPVSVVNSMNHRGPVRIVRPGQAVTMDYRPDRLTVEVDRRDRITRISCN